MCELLILDTIRRWDSDFDIVFLVILIRVSFEAVILRKFHILLTDISMENRVFLHKKIAIMQGEY